jgi:CheY-like chemotaxis protein
MNCAQTVRRGKKSDTRRQNLISGRDCTAVQELKALVVDDDPITLKLAAAMLGQIGYMACTAGEGAQALRDFSKAPCDLLLTDYVMPALNGYQLGCMIKSRHPGTRVVIMTGLNRTSVAEMMSDGSIDGWLFKPFNPADLKNLLERLGLPVKGSAE